MTVRALKASLSLWRRRLAYRQKKVDTVRGSAKSGRGRARPGVVTKAEAQRIHKWERLRDEAQRIVARREAQLAEQSKTMGQRAIAFAHTLVGVMEQGGNNIGPKVSEIIRANGGTPGEAWCGDFCAFVYRHVGSKAVTRSWAAVRLLRGLVGVVPVATPREGDLVRFTFDHVGLFVRDIGNGNIITIEGNTGASGAVSDSKTGGDGVYLKNRPKALVRDYLRIEK